MCKAEEFRQYAEEAARWSFKSKTEQEKQAFMDLARTGRKLRYGVSALRSSAAVRQNTEPRKGPSLGHDNPQRRPFFIELRAWRSCHGQIHDGASWLVNRWALRRLFPWAAGIILHRRPRMVRLTPVLGLPTKF